MSASTEIKPLWPGCDPAVTRWFAGALGAPTPAQARAWPAIAAGEHALIAAPTGSGKTLAAFLAAIDRLVQAAARAPLGEECRVLYVSPLKALSNDIQKNLEAPLNGIADALLESGRAAPEIRAMVRTGDTSAGERDRMRRHPPHILVTTPESLFILLGSESGRAMLATLDSVIVDEIHALIGSKRGAHLALSLERLDALAGRPLQRIGLSATQKPVAEVARFLTGEAPCHVVDLGHARRRDLALELPGSPLTAVMAGEVWGEIYDRVAALAAEHRSTLVFVNTRRLAERATRHLAERLGEQAVAAHHGSLSKEHRLAAEQRLKAGELTVLVATASLELGIDIGAVDLVCQIGSPRSINALLQRVGRSGHAVNATPKGRLFPTSLDELVECTALLAAIGQGQLDELRPAGPALDVLAQQIVGEVAARDWDAEALLALVRRSWTYRDLEAERWQGVLKMLAEGYSSRRGRRGAYLHWDRVNGRLRARRAARLVALTNAGVIPDQFDFDVVMLPEGLRVGSLNEDFAFESLPGDIFQLGNQSYRILKVEGGRVLVEDARGLPPTVPFWFGEAPGRSDELSQAVSALRQAVSASLADGLEAAVARLQRDYGLSGPAAVQLAEYLGAGERALGEMPTAECIVFERFFDETGDMHLVIHSPLGSRLNKAWGLALRKRFCRKFNFELQAAALEDSIVLSLGVTHSFPLAEVAEYLHPESVASVLEQAVLDAPMFPTHWRWNASIALAIRRHLGNRRTPPVWQRNDAEDLMAVVFPDQIACAENLAGAREIPDHPLVRQTLHDCLYELMDLPGLAALLSRIRAGEVRIVTAELNAPSPLAQEILNARPYAFLDDGDAEARRTLAVAGGQTGYADAEALRVLAPEALAQVRAEAWPQPRDAEELHDALVIHGGFEAAEAAAWHAFLAPLEREGRATRLTLPGDGQRWVAAERLAEWQALHVDARATPPIRALPAETDDPLRELLRGRLEAVGPVGVDALAAWLGQPASRVEPGLLALESEGFVVRGRFGGDGEQWCERRLLARIHRYSRERKRSAIRPVSATLFQRFVLRWQGLSGERPEGLDAILAAFDRLEGYSAPAAAWERELLPARIGLYLPAQLDSLCAAGKLAWARIVARSGGGRAGGPVKQTPIAFAPRESLSLWRGLGGAGAGAPELSSDAAATLEYLRTQGAAFFSDLCADTGLLRAQQEAALAELVGQGLITADTFAGLRSLIQPQRGRPRQAPRTRRRRPLFSGVQDAGRWSRLPAPAVGDPDDAALEHYLWAVLARYGVVFRKLLEREACHPPWRRLLRVAWRLEARGEIRGGRFVDGLAGEQFALPEAVEALRAERRAESDATPLRVAAADPAHLTGTVLPGPKMPAGLHNAALYRDGQLVAWLAGGAPQLADGIDPAERGELFAALTQPLAERARRRA